MIVQQHDIDLFLPKDLKSAFAVSRHQRIEVLPLQLLLKFLSNNSIVID